MSIALGIYLGGNPIYPESVVHGFRQRIAKAEEKERTAGGDGALVDPDHWLSQLAIYGAYASAETAMISAILALDAQS